MNVCADVLTLQEVETHIYRDTESVSQREREKSEKGWEISEKDSNAAWQLSDLLWTVWNNKLRKEKISELTLELHSHIYNSRDRRINNRCYNRCYKIMLSRYMLMPSVRLSVTVCLSVTIRSCTKTSKHGITRSLRSLIWTESPVGTPHAGAVSENRRLSTNNSLYLKNGTK